MAADADEAEQAKEGDGAGTAVSASGFSLAPMTEEEKETAAADLSDLARLVLFEQGTERAFTGETVNGYAHDNPERGTYVCAVGGLPLFHSDHKFDSGTGWPSFFQTIDPEHVREQEDVFTTSKQRYVMHEVVCARSGGHLGHVFADGPQPTGLRYCINAAALRFIPEGEEIPKGNW